MSKKRDILVYSLLVWAIVIWITLLFQYFLHDAEAESNNSGAVSVVNQLIIEDIKRSLFQAGYFPRQKATLTIKKFQLLDEETSAIVKYSQHPPHPITKELISDDFFVISFYRDSESGNITEVMHTTFALERVRKELVKEVEENGESFEIEVGSK